MSATGQEEKVKIVHKWHGESLAGTLWFIGWLFTIGYLHLPFFWKGVLALFIWPYYLGRTLAH
ncbi:MAG: hypothetical protein K6T77_06340 [candidate division WOR-3 bacterium]|jgi:hypothetical protein|nr:hypothetical protein [candidate division WOR-3 bacterium]